MNRMFFNEKMESIPKIGEAIKMGAEAKQVLWDNREAIQLRAGRYEALVVPSLGANVLQLLYHDERDGRTLDILRTPDRAQTLLDDPYAYGIPVLFPANRIAGGGFTYDGVTYRFPQNYPNGVHIHGVLHYYDWPLADCWEKERTAAVVLEADTEDPILRRSFPIDLNIRLECILGEDGLLQRFTLDNRSEATMPFGLAYHTAFRIPFTPGGAAEDVRLHLPLEGLCIDDPKDRLPSGEIAPLSEYEAGFVSPQGRGPLEHPLDNLYRAQCGGGEAVLRDIRTGREVVYAADASDKYWIIWNGREQKDFVAVEPQTWLSNAVHLPNPELHGVMYLSPHSQWQCENRIFVR